MSEALYAQALRNMEDTMHLLAERVSPPQRVPYRDGFVFRYLEKTAHQALVQKLARYLSTLRAAQILLTVGYYQEQATLQRALDEIHEDVSFLAMGIVFRDETESHKAYLDAFFAEEFDAIDAMSSKQRRPMIPRQKIRAYIAKCGGHADPSAGAEAARTVSKTYSGYVHSASPQIMDMYGGDPPRFHVSGMRGTPLVDEHRNDLWNYYYRGILTFAFAAKAFADDELSTRITNFAQEFSDSAGRNYASYIRGEA